MTPTRAELRALLARAARGPWTDDGPNIDARQGIVATAFDLNHIAEGETTAALIVAAVNALPGLLDALDAAEAERDDYASGRRYDADPGRLSPAPIDSLANLWRDLRVVLGAEGRKVFAPLKDILALQSRALAAETRVAELEQDQPCFFCGEVPATGTHAWCGRNKCT